MISRLASCLFYFELYVVLLTCPVFGFFVAAAAVCAEIRERILSWPIWLSDLLSISLKLSLGIFGENKRGRFPGILSFLSRPKVFSILYEYMSLSSPFLSFSFFTWRWGS
ncbi:MAG: hypothetical protein JOS17DRAFT_742882 [Linnemannia elongata]|nr:MAG: hypothetical protein JOS17DRAFT_742882 [Linnemannia elongata]